MKQRVRVANPGEGGLWWRLPVLALLWSLIVIPVGAGIEVVSTMRRWAKDLPEVPDLASWKVHAPQSSTIVAADGSLLAEVPFRDGPVFGHRTLVSLARAPKVLIEAVLAAEDVRFYRHKGADYTAIARAAYLNYQAGRVVEGASTITQQVARNLLPDSIGTSRNMRRKFREVLLAREIEKRWTKREILEVYLSFVFLGEGSYGMEAAAHTYFDKDITDLDLAQSALLAGLIQAPGRLDPYKHPERAKARRDEILARMARAELITEAERTTAAATPVELHRPPSTYGARVPWYTEKARSLVSEALPDDLARGGLTIETAALPALGSELQQRAREQAETWKQPETGVVPQIASIVWDHQTGYVEAIVGGREWGLGRPNVDQFDRFLLSCRQPGSAWKAMVYGAALEAGAITPGTALRDAPIAEYDEVTNVHYRPKSGHSFRGIVLAEDAFASSLNAPAIDVFEHVGPARIIDFARRLGISTKISQLTPMALGASCVHPIELARAYAIIARRGWSIAPRFVVRVRRGDEALFDAAVPEDPWLDASRRLDRMAAIAGEDPDVRVAARGGRVVDDDTAFQLQHMMAAVVSRGTASAASGSLGRPAAGKTGTTNENTDAWFVGYTGRVLAATWIGFDTPSIKLGREGDGAHAALPLWLKAIKLAEGDRPRSPVPGKPPRDLEVHTIDRETGFLAAPHAPGLDVWFRKGTEPTQVAGAPGTTPGDFAATAREF